MVNCDILRRLRTYRILKLAHTIGDLAGCEEIQPVHTVDVLQYRPKLMLSSEPDITNDVSAELNSEV